MPFDREWPRVSGCHFSARQQSAKLIRVRRRRHDSNPSCRRLNRRVTAGGRWGHWGHDKIELVTSPIFADYSEPQDESERKVQIAYRTQTVVRGCRDWMRPIHNILHKSNHSSIWIVSTAKTCILLWSCHTAVLYSVLYIVHQSTTAAFYLLYLTSIFCSLFRLIQVIAHYFSRKHITVPFLLD